MLKKAASHQQTKVINSIMGFALRSKLQNLSICISAFLIFIFLSVEIHSQIESEVFLKGAAVTDIEEEEGFLWVSTYGQGIYRYSIADGKWTNFSTKSGNLSDDLFYAVEVSKNFVWAASVEG